MPIPNIIVVVVPLITFSSPIPVKLLGRILGIQDRCLYYPHMHEDSVLHDYASYASAMSIHCSTKMAIIC